MKELLIIFSRKIMNWTIDLDEYAEGAILLTDLEDCIVGVVEEFGNGRRILYSKQLILNKLKERDLMTEEEAEEFYDYNILGLYAGEQNAVFLDKSITPKINDNGNYDFLINVL
jgi:hypothetical protein